MQPVHHMLGVQAKASLVQLLRLLHAVFQLDAGCEPGALQDLYGPWLHVLLGFGQRCSPSLAAVWCQAVQQVSLDATEVHWSCADLHLADISCPQNPMYELMLEHCGLLAFADASVSEPAD